jgi:DNA-binding MarR family transcriptional regulator
VTGVSAARLSALSVLVFRGPCTVGALADAEQVSAPTMTRLAQELEREGWLRRRADPDDARTARLEATPAARRLLLRGRDRRIRALAGALTALDAQDRLALERAVKPLEQIVNLLGVTGPPRTARRGRRRHD